MTKVTLNANTECAKARKQTRVSGLAAMVAAMTLVAMTLAGTGDAKADELNGTNKFVIDDTQVAEWVEADRDVKAKGRAGNGTFIFEFPSSDAESSAYYSPPTASWSEPHDHIPQIRLYTVWSW